MAGAGASESWGWGQEDRWLVLQAWREVAVPALPFRPIRGAAVEVCVGSPEGMETFITVNRGGWRLNGRLTP
jgi:hypothetical protein